MSRGLFYLSQELEKGPRHGRSLAWAVPVLPFRVEGNPAIWMQHIHGSGTQASDHHECMQTVPMACSYTEETIPVRVIFILLLQLYRQADTHGEWLMIGYIQTHTKPDADLLTGQEKPLLL